MFASALEPAVRSAVEELSSIAVVRGVGLRLAGACTAGLAVPEARLRLALQYLITTTIEVQPEGAEVVLLLEEGPAGTVLRAEGDFRELKPNGTPEPASTLRRVRLAIASRVLENAGASLVFSDGGLAGFVLRIPLRG